MRYIARFVESRLGNLAGYRKEIPNLEVYIDDKRNALLAFVAALELAGEDACVQMEDDCILANDFTNRVEAEIAKRPETVIQFFSMRKDDLVIGSRWDDKYMMAQCTYYPRGYCAEIVRYFKGSEWERRADELNGLDTMVQLFLKSRKEKYWICVPNLVDHMIQKSEIDPRRSSKRVSKTFQR